MNLQLLLKTKWFKMSDDLIKTEEYREINEYWIKRLIDRNFSWNCQTVELIQQHLEACPNGFWKKFKTNTITLGYPKKGDLSRITKFEHAGIEIRIGNTEWGAELIPEMHWAKEYIKTDAALRSMCSSGFAKAFFEANR